MGNCCCKPEPVIDREAERARDWERHRQWAERRRQAAAKKIFEQLAPKDTKPEDFVVSITEASQRPKKLSMTVTMNKMKPVNIRLVKDDNMISLVFGSHQILIHRIDQMREETIRKAVTEIGPNVISEIFPSSWNVKRIVSFLHAIITVDFRDDDDY